MLEWPGGLTREEARSGRGDYRVVFVALEYYQRSAKVDAVFPAGCDSFGGQDYWVDVANVVVHFEAASEQRFKPTVAVRVPQPSHRSLGIHSSPCRYNS